jgi:Ca2+-binding RTX toxin-like protein
LHRSPIVRFTEGRRQVSDTHELTIQIKEREPVMLRFIQNLCGIDAKPAKRRNRPARHSQRRVLSMEGLEGRNLMAAGVFATALPVIQAQPVAPPAVTVSIENHDLVIRGTDAAEDVKVSAQEGKFVVEVTTRVNGRAFVTSSSWRPTGGDVFFYGFGGNDKFTASMGSVNYLRVIANGGEGHDSLIGSWGNDSLNGGGGDDYLYGHVGNDFLDGSFGVDKIEGGHGNDIIWCGPDTGWNQANGGAGNDTITGGYGVDFLNGGDGDDTLDGSYGEDYLFGEAGNDMLRAGNDSEYNYLDGGDGNDNLFGSYGNDYMVGKAGCDRLYGYAGNDIMHAGTGDDVLYGGDGDDELHGFWDEDSDDFDNMLGEGGKDTFYWNVGRPFNSFPVSYNPRPAVEDLGEIHYEGW